MKFLVVSVVCLFSVVQAGLLSDEQKAKIKAISSECLKETGVDEALANKAMHGEYVDDPKLKQQLFCFNKKAGFQNEAGDFQEDVIKTKLVAMIKDPQQAEALMKKCLIKKETGEETAFATTKCFHELSPSKEVF